MKIDYKKQFRDFYSASSGSCNLVDVPNFKFIMIDGRGDPNNSKSYADSVKSLYSVAYKIKFACKKDENDFVVMPLEGLWWAENMSDFNVDDKSNWLWTMMIMQPPFVDDDLFEQSKRAAVEKNPEIGALIESVRIEEYHEGLSAQTLHVGPYSNEAPTIKRLHDFIAEHHGGLVGAGRHHEIYLNDPGRSDPALLKTIIRQPFSRL